MFSSFGFFGKVPRTLKRVLSLDAKKTQREVDGTCGANDRREIKQTNDRRMNTNYYTKHLERDPEEENIGEGGMSLLKLQEAEVTSPAAARSHTQWKDIVKTQIRPIVNKQEKN